MMTDTPRRGPGRPPKTVQPDAGPTAAERIQRLVDARGRGQVIVPMPDGLLQRASRYSPEDSDQAVQRENQETVQIAHMWLMSAANQGGSQDVDTAWYSLTGNKAFKDRLHNEYTELRHRADRNYMRLAAEADQEAAAARQDWLRRQEAMKLRKQIEADEKALAVKRQRLLQLTGA